MEASAELISDKDDQRAAQPPDPTPTPFAKVAFDKLVAAAALILLAPVFGSIALAVKIDGWLHPENRGAVFYREERVSQGRVFALHKFRVAKTSAIEAATQQKGYRHMKPLEKDETKKTRVGRWLQKWYLDELPQLLNVLKGDMSFVGPRPYPVHKYEREIAQAYYQKHVLRPGLTGLVQAHKGELARFGGGRALDEAYIEACCTLGPAGLVLFDLRVLLVSLKTLAKGEGL
jgi:lipopolysaccharide/colanic/teichoic acid biosynthesis glycosyltransferase